MKDKLQCIVYLQQRPGLGPGRAGPLSLHGALARSERRDLFGNAAQISRDITFLPSLTWLPFASHRNTRNATQRRLANMTKLRAHARFGGKASKNEREREGRGRPRACPSSASERPPNAKGGSGGAKAQKQRKIWAVVVAETPCLCSLYLHLHNPRQGIYSVPWVIIRTSTSTGTHTNRDLDFGVLPAGKDD